MSQRRLGWLFAAVLWVGVACANEPETEVLSVSRQAVDVGPARTLASASGRETVSPTVETGDGVVLIADEVLPDVLAFKEESPAAASADAALEPTTTLAPRPAPIITTTVAPEPDDTTTTTDTLAPPPTIDEPGPVAPSSGCPAPRHDNGIYERSARATGLVDDDDLPDLVVVGYDDDGAIRILIDHGDGGQTSVGTLPPVGEDAARLRIEFTGDPSLPIIVRQGTGSVSVRIVECTPMRG